jgi:hypothetical protein
MENNAKVMYAKSYIDKKLIIDSDKLLQNESNAAVK